MLNHSQFFNKYFNIFNCQKPLTKHSESRPMLLQLGQNFTEANFGQYTFLLSNTNIEKWGFFTFNVLNFLPKTAPHWSANNTIK